MVGNVHTFKCTPKYHCETQLAQFFIQKKIGQRTIGCSKLTCSSCNVFLENIEAPSAAVLASASGRKSVFGHWHLSGSSAKSHFAWRIPDKQLFNNMNDDLWRTVTAAGSATLQAAKDELYKVLKDIYLNGGGPKPGDPSNSRFKHNRINLLDQTAVRAPIGLCQWRRLCLTRKLLMQLVVRRYSRVDRLLP